MLRTGTAVRCRAIALLVGVGLVACSRRDRQDRADPATDVAVTASAPPPPRAPAAVAPSGPRAPRVPPSATAESPVARASPPPQPWIELYYPGWTIPLRPPRAIPLAGVTDVILFSLLPEPIGPRVEFLGNGLSPDRVASVVAVAHAARAKVLVGVGGDRTGVRFRAAIAADEGRALAARIAEFTEEHGLDGVVLDVEPIEDVPPALFHAFVHALRDRLRADGGTARLEAVVAPDLDEIGRLAPVVDALDRVAVMSYLGPSGRSVDGGARARPDARMILAGLRAIGVPAAQIGVGLDANTTPADSKRLASLVDAGRAGGFIAWHAGTLCDAEVRAPCTSLEVARGWKHP